MGYLPVALKRPHWLISLPVLLLHTRASATIYYFLGRLVVAFYNTDGVVSLLLWPLLLLVNP